MGADGQLVGLTCVFGILADGGGQLLHRGGGFFQIGGLLLGALRQILVAASDFMGGKIDARCCALDIADDRGQLRDGGVGIVTDLREHAMEVAVHALGQIAAGQRCQYPRDLADAAVEGFQQAIELI